MADKQDNEDEQIDLGGAEESKSSREEETKYSRGIGAKNTRFRPIGRGRDPKIYPETLEEEMMIERERKRREEQIRNRVSELNKEISTLQNQILELQNNERNEEERLERLYDDKRTGIEIKFDNLRRDRQFGTMRNSRQLGKERDLEIRDVEVERQNAIESMNEFYYETIKQIKERISELNTELNRTIYSL